MTSAEGVRILKQRYQPKRSIADPHARAGSGAPIGREAGSRELARVQGVAREAVEMAPWGDAHDEVVRLAILAHDEVAVGGGGQAVGAVRMPSVRANWAAPSLKPCARVEVAAVRPGRFKGSGSESVGSRWRSMLGSGSGIRIQSTRKRLPGKKSREPPSRALPLEPSSPAWATSCAPPRSPYQFWVRAAGIPTIRSASSTPPLARSPARSCEACLLPFVTTSGWWR